MLAGHESALQVAEHQPTKLAAIEGLWNSEPAGSSPAWSVLAGPDEAAGRNRWSLAIPGGFSWNLEGRSTLSHELRGLNSWPVDQRPRMVGLLFYSFRLMAGIGIAITLLMVLTVLLWWRRGLSAETMLALPWLGWAWTVYGQLRTADAASQLPAAEVLRLAHHSPRTRPQPAAPIASGGLRWIGCRRCTAPVIAMEFLDIFMPAVWFVILALFLLLYVILDGFDLGARASNTNMRLN